MKHSKILLGTGAALGMLVLILDGRTAVSGAQTGLILCLVTLIPSLFPFFLLSGALMKALSGVKTPFLSLVGRLCGIPTGCEAVLLPGFLGGYPVGAQAVASAWQSGQLSKKQAERMLAFCSNAGPAFLFGVCGSFFPKLWMVWALWGIHIISAVLTAWCSPKVDGTASEGSFTHRANPDIFMNALRGIGIVCGWVIFFRVIISFLERWVLWCLPAAVQTMVMGLLELANGCCALGDVPSTAVRFLLCAGMLAFGGVCVTMQTASVASGLSIKPYIRGKLTQTGFSLLLSAILVFPPARMYCLLLTALILLLGKKQKRCRFPEAVRV